MIFIVSIGAAARARQLCEDLGRLFFGDDPLPRWRLFEFSDSRHESTHNQPMFIIGGETEYLSQHLCLAIYAGIGRAIALALRDVTSDGAALRDFHHSHATEEKIEVLRPSIEERLERRGPTANRTVIDVELPDLVVRDAFVSGQT